MIVPVLMFLVLLAVSQNWLGAVDAFMWVTHKFGVFMSQQITKSVVPTPTPR